MISALKHSGNVIIIGFVIVALSLLFLAYKATQVNFDMAVEGDYYEQEVAYNHQLEAEQNAKKFATGFTFKQDGSKILMTVPTELSQQLEKGSVRFFCLSNSKMDVIKPITSTTDGQYIFDRATVAPGHNYIVKLSFASNGVDYYKEFRLQ